MDGSPDSPAPTRTRVAASTVVAWGGAVAFPVVLYVIVVNTHDESSVLRSLLPALVMALPAGLLRRHPLTVMALVLAGSFAATAALGTGAVGYSQVVLMALAVGVVAAIERRRVSIVALVATLALQTAAVPFYTSGSDVFLRSIVFVALAVFAAWMTGDSIRERRSHGEALRSVAAEQAVIAERLRIARELHDIIAHSIGVIAIQAGVGSRVIETQPAEARNALDIIEATSRQTLAELRRVLGGLRRIEPDPGSDSRPLDPAPTLADVDRIAAAARDAGVRVDVWWQGRRRPLAVEVVDDGRGGVVPGTGHGIVGMRERVALLHGEFSAGPRPEGGFRVAARLPVPAEL